MRLRDFESRRALVGGFGRRADGCETVRGRETVEATQAASGDAQRRAERLTVLNAVSRLLSSRLRVEEVLDEVVRAAQRLLDADHVHLWTLEADRQQLRLSVTSSPPGESTLRVLPLNGSVAGEVLRSGEVYQTADVVDDARWTNRALTAAAELHGYLGIPLIARGESLGVLSILCHERRVYSEEDLDLMRAFAAQAAIAIANARLFGQAERRARRLAAWSEASRLVTSSLDLDAVLAAVVRSAKDVFDVDRARLWALDEASGDVVLMAASDGDVEGQGWITRMRTTGTLLGEVLTSGDVLQTPDILEHPLVQNRQYMEAEGLHGYIAVPLQLKERPFGVLVLFSRDRRYFQEDEVEILRALGQQAAVAIENARLFEVVGQVEALRELDRLKTEFLSTVSHELRTPLSYIHGYAELLLTRELTRAEVSEMAREIHRGSTSMVRLVDDLLDVSRIESGHFSLQAAPTKIEDLLTSLAGVLRVQADHHSITLDLPDRPLPSVLVDPARARQVLSNLLSNAVQYSPDGGEIVVSARAERRHVRVEVRDQGPGIPRDEQPRLWERFYRGRHAVISAHRGSGLGLAIVKHLVEAHGGEVGVESVVGQGSTFWLTLPTVQD
jgi:K+-sensing histidine kinase KdpD